MPISRLLLSEAQTDELVERIRSADQAWQLRKALNCVVMCLDTGEDEFVEDAFHAFKDEVRSNYGVDMDQRVRSKN